MQDIVQRSYAKPPRYAETAAGLPEGHEKITTLGGLLEINYKQLGCREQMRRNLLARLSSGAPRYPGIIGFDDTVLPALDRAILAGHDIFLIGQIGQAKTRIARCIAENLLSPVPAIHGSITCDSPFDLPEAHLAALLADEEVPQTDPVFYISPESAKKIRDCKLETRITWVPGESRFKYVLATPETSVRDIIGYVDAIKVARGGVEMHAIESYSPGQLMQAKHGIFCIDELPVLDPRKQVALLSALEEGRFTTGAYPVIFEPRTCMIATANPTNYTHSGRIIEPLHDRLSSHIRTHYPQDADAEAAIMLQEACIGDCVLAAPVLYTLASVVAAARDAQSDSGRGISARFGIHALEVMYGEACRVRGNSESPVFLRLADAHCITQAAKFAAFDLDDSAEKRDARILGMLREAMRRESAALLDGASRDTLDAVSSEFAGATFAASQEMLWRGSRPAYSQELGAFPALKSLAERSAALLRERQNETVQKLSRLSPQTTALDITRDRAGGLMAEATEMTLEGLVCTDPPILQRSEAGYAAA